MPKPDLNGFCNNQFANHFLIGASNQCTQSVDLSKDCGDSMILDARAWTTNLQWCARPNCGGKNSIKEGSKIYKINPDG